MQLTSRYGEAFNYAMEVHGDQTRKGTSIPYISHLMAVSSSVLEAGGNEDEAIAGLLHDAIEDTDATAQDIEERFGPKVAEIVVACSDTDVKPKPPWKARKEAYLAHLKEAPTYVLRVSAADKLHNARSILMDFRTRGNDLWDVFNTGVEGQLWYYQSLAQIFEEKLPSPLSRELLTTVQTIRSEVEATNG